MTLAIGTAGLNPTVLRDCASRRRGRSDSRTQAATRGSHPPAVAGPRGFALPLRFGIYNWQLHELGGERVFCPEPTDVWVGGTSREAALMAPSRFQTDFIGCLFPRGKEKFFYGNPERQSLRMSSGDLVPVSMVAVGPFSRNVTAASFDVVRPGYTEYDNYARSRSICLPDMLCQAISERTINDLIEQYKAIVRPAEVPLGHNWGRLLSAHPLSYFSWPLAVQHYMNNFHLVQNAYKFQQLIRLLELAYRGNTEEQREQLDALVADNAQMRLQQNIFSDEPETIAALTRMDQALKIKLIAAVYLQRTGSPLPEAEKPALPIFLEGQVYRETVRFFTEVGRNARTPVFGRMLEGVHILHEIDGVVAASPELGYLLGQNNEARAVLALARGDILAYQGAAVIDAFEHVTQQPITTDYLLRLPVPFDLSGVIFAHYGGGGGELDA